MLLELRYKTAEGSDDKAERTSSAGERGIWKAWRIGMMGRKRFDIGARIAGLALRPLSRNGWLKKAPPPISGWTSSRDFPTISTSSLRSKMSKRGKGGK